MSKLSIIVPSYNHAGFLDERLNSIVNQTFKDWEMIIIDDCSTDDSQIILKEFVKENKSRIKAFIVNDKNSGSGYFSWKKGLDLVQTKYIWIAETDDYSDPTFLEKLVSYIENNDDVNLVFSASNYVEDGVITYDTSFRTKDLDVNDSEFKKFPSSVLIDKMPFETLITNASSVVFRTPKKSIPETIFQHKQSSDLFLWTHLVEHSNFAFFNQKLNYFRRHKDSTTTKISSSSSRKIYDESIDYINYFKQTDKIDILLDHYIKNYVWNNKKHFLNCNFLNKLESDASIIKKYYQKLFKYFCFKITKK